MHKINISESNDTDQIKIFYYSVSKYNDQRRKESDQSRYYTIHF